MSAALLERPAHDIFDDVLWPGYRLSQGQYTIAELLSWGSFGITYLASDRMNRTIVIKECFPTLFCRRDGRMVVPQTAHDASASDAALYLSLQEARAISQLRHPNIASVQKVFEENNTCYVAYDFVDGFDLLEFIESGAACFSPSELREMLQKLLGAISLVHRAGLLHRDISPENIIITKENEPVIIEFGSSFKALARHGQRPSETPIPNSGYAPHEFFVSGSKQDPTADLYSLAASFYHLISGQMPADSQTRMSAYLGGKPDPYVPLGTLTDDFDAAFCNALDCALSLLPKDRLRSAAEWQRKLTTKRNPSTQLKTTRLWRK